MYNEHEIFDVAIVGAGAAGLTAAIYSARAKQKTLVLNEGAVGGQMVLTNEIANYPGVELTTGYNLAATMRKQAKLYGAKLVNNIKIADYQLNQTPKKIILDDGTVYHANSVILAVGGKPRGLGAIGESDFKGKGISYCATCDGEFFEGKNIFVVGGGNSALEEAIALTNFAQSVTIIHQFDHFQAFEQVVEDAKSNPKISFILNSTITKFEGGDRLEGVEIKNLKTGNKQMLPIDGVFIFVGYEPNTASISHLVSINERSEVIVDKNMQTNIDGVFAAGDCIAKRYRQVTTAVAEGTIASLAAADYVRNLKHILA